MAAPLPAVTGARDDVRAGGPRERGGVVAAGVVGHPQLGPRQRPAQRRERRPDACRLVAGRDDHPHGRAAGGRGVFGIGRGDYCCAPTAVCSRGGAMPQVEAHITGTVWKIECAVGDAIEEGDTVAILESMKMEMPVEAEDAGTVKEICCEEGQAVSEGDTLVVLE